MANRATLEVSQVTRQNFIVGFVATLAALSSLGLAPAANAQTYSLDPLAWAVPVAQRPPELQAAKDLIVKDDQRLRLRAEVWVWVDPCPNKKRRENCLIRTETQGRVFIGPFWYDRVLPGLEVEKLWLLHKGGVWSTDKIRRASDGNFEFEQGPPLPGNTNIDVLVKVRGVTDLLQVRYRTVYQKGRGG